MISSFANVMMLVEWQTSFVESGSSRAEKHVDEFGGTPNKKLNLL